MWDEMKDLLKRQLELRHESILNELQDNWCSPEEQAIPSDHESTPPDLHCPLDGGVQADANVDEEPEAIPGTDAHLVEDIAMGGDCSDDMAHHLVNADVHQIDPFVAGENNDWALDPSLRDGSSLIDASAELETPRPETLWIPFPQFQQQHRGQFTQSRPIARSRRATPKARRGTTPSMNTHDVHPGLFGSLESFDDLFGACIGQYFPPMSPTFFPSMTFPTLLGDEAVRSIIERAKENPHSIGPPTLEDFLFDNPRNTLSTDLKNYLTPVRQARKVSEFLATYWLIYLFFRVRIRFPLSPKSTHHANRLLQWQVLQTDEAYDALPQWFRPTMLQLSVVHPASADLIAW